MALWIGHWIFCTLTAYNTLITIYSMALSPIQSYCHYYTVCSLSVVHYTCTESSWSAVPKVLGYRLPMADVSLLGFPNCLCRTATATLDSLCTYWNSLLELCPIATSLVLLQLTRALKFFLMKLKLIYDRRSVGQSVLVSDSHLKLVTRILFSDNCRFLDVGRLL
jgi:hypothetical protein